jgi:hypothetical protein
MHTRLSMWLLLVCGSALAQQAAELTQLRVDDFAQNSGTSLDGASTRESSS